MAKRGRKKAEPFASLPPEFKAAIEGGSDVEIRNKICETAMNQAALMEAMKLDQDLAEKKEAMKVASAQYREGTKANKEKIAYARFILDARGKPSGDSGIDTGELRDAVEKFVDLTKKVLKPGESITFGPGATIKA